VRSRAERIGVALLGLIFAAALLAPVLAVNPPDEQFADHAYAPPMWPRIRDPEGRLQRPFVYPLRLVDRLEMRFEEDRGRRTTLRWFTDGKLVGVDAGQGPWLLFGGDTLGRDVWSRLVLGARLSLGVAFVAAVGALGIGTLVGALSGFAGGRLDTILMSIADLVIVLPAMYVVLALRAAMPLVLTTGEVFWATSAVLALAGWPFAARGVRAIVAVENRKEYAESARVQGASSWRILRRHLIPATTGYLVVQGTLLFAAFVLAEATLSFVGLGFAEPLASWGGMLRQAAFGRAFAQAPWLLSPVGAIVLTVLGLQLLGSPAVRSGLSRGSVDAPSI
jgi:peptide/nickel transport system permease protein